MRNGGRSRRKASPAPVDLRAGGQAVWSAVRALGHVQPGDVLAVERLARLEDQAAVLGTSIEKHGVVLCKPMIHPRCGIIGEERYPHPALQALRKIGSGADAVCDALGPPPTSRQHPGLALLLPPDQRDRLPSDHSSSNASVTEWRY